MTYLKWTMHFRSSSFGPGTSRLSVGSSLAISLSQMVVFHRGICSRLLNNHTHYVTTRQISLDFSLCFLMGMSHIFWVVYFGEPSLKSCSVEHKRSVRSCDCEKNEIEKNCWEVDHNFSWGQKKVNHNNKICGSS